MASSQVTKPVFPREIWSTVFSNFKKDHEIVHLWTDCRHVCRQFKGHIFSIKHLKKTTINFDCGIWYNEEAFGGKVNLRNISFGFNRFANEGETAVFKIEDSAEEFMSVIMGRVDYCIDAESTIETPGHLVCFRGVVNDTEVPGLAIDAMKREISFDWRAMFSRFLAERKLYNYILHQNLYSDEAGISKAQQLKEKVDRGEIDMYESMEAGLAMYSRALDVSRKSARRARIRRQWTAEGQSCVFDEDFEGEEKAALKKLKEVEFWASWADISDDEREEEAESASRRKATTASEEHEEDDESSVGEVDDDQDVDDDQSVSDDQDVEDDKDLEEERGEDADNDQEN